MEKLRRREVFSLCNEYGVGANRGKPHCCHGNTGKPNHAVL